MAVRVRGKILYVDFRCHLPDGRRVRCVESTGLRVNKKKKKESEKNRKIAKAKDEAIKYELDHGRFNYLHFFPTGSKAKYFIDQPSQNMIFRDLWDKWFQVRVIRKNTRKGWRSSYAKHIAPAFGDRLVEGITTTDIETFRLKLVERGLKASSINDKIMKPLQMCLLQAVRDKILEETPCKSIKRLEEQTVDVDPFSFKEAKILLKHLKVNNPEMHDLIIVWLRTGLRPGEIMALKWSRVDWYNKKLMIRETHHSSGEDGPVKTKSSNRDIDLVPVAIEALRRQKKRTGRLGGYIFMTEAKRAYSTEYMVKRFRILLGRANLRYRPPRQLRHTFASLHLGAGENITWVSRMLGHKNARMTWERYNRFIPNLTSTDGSAFDRKMGGSRKSGRNRTKKR